MEYHALFFYCIMPNVKMSRGIKDGILWPKKNIR